MYEYVEGKAMWANVTTPNTRFGDPKYQITVLTDKETAERLESVGLSQVKDRAGNFKYEAVSYTHLRAHETDS